VRHELELRAPGAAPVRHAIAQPVSGGGSHADGVLLPGASPGAVRLVPVVAGVVVEAGAAGVRVAGHALAPGARRLLRPGEHADVQGVTVALERGPVPDGVTRAAAAALLREAAGGAAPIPGPRLTVLTGPAAGERHPLGAEQTIGRGRSATLRLADPQASRVHARIRLGPDGATVEDLRSKNGLRLNGVPLDRRRAARLASGDELAIGETVLVFEEPGPPAASAAPPRGGGEGPRRRRRGRLPPHVAAAALLALSAVALALAAA
jgi:hypothetical protein